MVSHFIFVWVLQSVSRVLLLKGRVISVEREGDDRFDLELLWICCHCWIWERRVECEKKYQRIMIIQF